MTREEAKELLPIIQAFVAGKQIQDAIEGLTDWVDTDEINLEYYGQRLKHRIKPEPKYRTFKTQEECWNEMLKHQPLGWVKSKAKDNKSMYHICVVGISYVLIEDKYIGFPETFAHYEFSDGTPFGIKEE